MTARVVIVGGGFAGLFAARRLARGDVQITLVDRQNYHLFQPLLYQVATAGLSPGDIASPIRALVSKYKNVTVKLGEVTGVDLAARQVQLREGDSLPYDRLILCTGVRHSYFGQNQWEALAPGLKSLDDALEIRRRVLLAFERAEVTNDLAERRSLLTFVVVGAGPTGVELAGSIAELSQRTFKRDFRAIDSATARVVLIEAGPRALAAFDAPLAAHATETLEKLGVEVRFNAKVTDISKEGVTLGTECIPAATVLWAAGVEASPLAQSLGVPLDRAGRVKVGADLRIPGHPEAMVLGDLASTVQADGTPLPGLAPVAMQQGRWAASAILASLEGKSTPPFRYVDKGIMATVGRASGIAQAGRLRLWGLLGWLAWLFIHLIFLNGFRNRLLVFIQWAYAYFTYARGARLITGLTPVPGSVVANMPPLAERERPRPVALVK
jgi:NADH dehydrogenase